MKLNDTVLLEGQSLTIKPAAFQASGSAEPETDQFRFKTT
jgi:hypothetical protein